MNGQCDNAMKSGLREIRIGCDAIRRACGAQFTATELSNATLSEHTATEDGRFASVTCHSSRHPIALV